jgi:tetratricopeptide (TPR) repeat protein
MYATQAAQTNDRALFRYWRGRALDEARRVPNGEAFAVPMVKADLLAIGGDPVEASRSYQALEASLKVAAEQDPSFRASIETVRERHRGVLGVSMATAALQYAQAKREADPDGISKWQRLATSCADRLYLLEPTEKSLQVLLATYAQVGMDVREIRRTAAADDQRSWDLVIQQLSPALRPSGAAPDRSPPIQLGSIKIELAPDPATEAQQLRERSYAGQALVQRAERHILDLINRAHGSDDYVRCIQNSQALILMGNDRQGLSELKEARSLFQAGRVPRTPGNLSTEITVLHRLVGITNIAYAYQSEVLTEARDLVTALSTYDRNQATLLQIENMEMSAEVRANQGASSVSRPDASSDEQEEAAKQYQAALRAGQMEIVRYCEKALISTTDRVTRDQVGSRLFAARAQILELDLGRALVLHQKDDRDEAQKLASQAIQEFNEFDAKFQDVPDSVGYREGMGRARLAEAQYQFRTGRIEESIATLRTMANASYDSTAVRILRTGWPRKAGIVGSDGKFKDTNQRDVLAAIKTAAGQLSKKQGRGLAACGVGAALFAVADLAVGEKVSGVAVIGGCVAGYIADRAVLLAQAHNEIAASYRTGVSSVSTEEALAGVGLFALNLASMYFGGAVGGLAQRAVLAGGSRLGAGMTSFLISRGLTPGPWTRAAGAFLLREASYVGNAVAFHKSSGVLQRSVINLFTEGSVPENKDTAQDTLLSWLFVRFMPLATDLNIAGRFIKGNVRWDAVARAGVNSGVGLGAVQGLHALAAQDPNQISLDRFGSMAWEFLAMHKGNRLFSTVLPMRRVSDLSARLGSETLRNLRRIREEIENAPPVGDWRNGGFGGMQPAFSFAAGPRGGGVAAFRGPDGIGSFRLPSNGVGFRPMLPILMMSSDDRTNPQGRAPSRGRVNDGTPVEGNGEAPVPRRVGSRIIQPSAFALPPQPRTDVQNGTPQSDVTLDHNGLLKANALLEFYDDPQTQATLDHYLRDRGPWGDAAETASVDLAGLRRLVPEYKRLAEIQRTTPSPANEAEMNQIGRDVMRSLTRLQGAAFDKMLSAHAARAERFENELEPLGGSLATLEVGSWEAGRQTVRYDMVWARPEDGLDLSLDLADPQNSFSKVSSQELVSVDVGVADRQAGQRVVEQLSGDHLIPSKARFEGDGGIFEAEVPIRRIEGERTVTGTHRVTVRIHVDTSLAARAAPLSRVDAASHGFELAWNNGVYWTDPVHGNGRVPILRDHQVAVLEVRSGLRAILGTFADASSDVAQKVTDAPARERLNGMLQILQAIHDRCPVGDPRRAVIDASVSKVRAELGQSSSGSASIPHLWTTMSRAIVDVAAHDGTLPEGERVLPRVLRIEREVSIAQNIPSSDYDQALAARWRYRWASSDAARVSP